jgi:hypothetical protein
MQFQVDSDLQAVLEFMQVNIPTAKLVGVAESLPQMGRLLWGHFSQEPFGPVRMRIETATEAAGRSQSDANHRSAVYTMARTWVR